MDFFFGLFAGITFWPALIIALEVICLFGFVEFERGGFALISIVVTSLLLHFLFGISVFSFIYEHPLALIMWAAGYIAVGVAYSLFRWDRLGAKWRRNYDDADSDYMKKGIWAEKPVAAHSKNRIITWMMFWPWSMLWWIISDFVKELFTVIYRKIAKWYDAIMARHTKGATEPGAEAPAAGSQPPRARSR